MSPHENARHHRHTWLSAWMPTILVLLFCFIVTVDGDSIEGASSTPKASPLQQWLQTWKSRMGPAQLRFQAHHDLTRWSNRVHTEGRHPLLHSVTGHSGRYVVLTKVAAHHNISLGQTDVTKETQRARDYPEQLLLHPQLFDDPLSERKTTAGIDEPPLGTRTSLGSRILTRTVTTSLTSKFIFFNNGARACRLRRDVTSSPRPEVHLIDEDHLLLYLPANLSRALVETLMCLREPSRGAGGGFSWVIADSFVRAPPHLKVAPSLQPFMSARPSTQGDELLEVEVSIARGEAAVIQKAMNYAVAEGHWSCSIRWWDHSTDHISLSLHPTFTTGKGCGLLLRAMAMHPSVRWLERSRTIAQPMNHIASAVVQGGQPQGSPPSSPSITPSLPHPFWSHNITGRGEIIAIADGSVRTDSCFMSDPHETVAHYPQMNLQHRKIVSYHATCKTPPKLRTSGVATELLSNSSDTSHATHVLGSAVGEVIHPNSSLSNYNGVATCARAFVVDMSCGGVDGLVLPRSVSEVFSIPYAAGARISSNSWGFTATTPDHYDAYERQVDVYAESHPEHLLLFAAGNTPLRGISVPGGAKNVLTVGAHLNDLERLNDVAAFSAYGATFDGRPKPDVLGPGDSVVSASGDGESCAVATKRGTSMSTAVIAGSAALVRQYMREWMGIPNPSSALLKAALMHSTELAKTDLAKRGFGRVNLSLLMQWPVHSTTTMNGPPVGIWARDGLMIEDRESTVMCFSAVVPPAWENDRTSAPPELRVTLVWTDLAMRVEGSTRSLVHELDLLVVDTDGKVTYPVGSSQEPANGPQRGNNVEQIRVPLTPQLARGFRVVVYGALVRAAARQSYALVVSAPQLRYQSDCGEVYEHLARGGVQVHCPGNCSGSHGVCNNVTKQCTCKRSYQFVDCSLCDELEVCHGHGTCSSTDLTCHCAPGTHFADDRCTTCADGWYGPDCTLTCECQNGGTCDSTTGQCQCPKSNGFHGGCFDGPKCEYCCPGVGGVECDKRSYWCDESGKGVEVRDAGGGFIQINDYNSYANSLSCHWSIIAPVGHRITLEYLSFDLATSQDKLLIYDFSTRNSADHLVRKDSGHVTLPVTVTSSDNTLELFFISNWEGSIGGFVLWYSFIDPAKLCGNDNRCVPPELTAKDAVTCAMALGLPEWCICSAPYFGPKCGHLEVPRGWSPRGHSERRPLLYPSSSVVSSESTIMLRLEQHTTVKPTVVVGSVGTRLPLVINGYSLLHIYLFAGVDVAVHAGITNDRATLGKNATTSQDVTEPPSLLQVSPVFAIVNVTLVPVGNQDWLANENGLIPTSNAFAGLHFGVAMVNALGAELSSTDMSRMLLLSNVDRCPAGSLVALSMAIPLPPGRDVSGEGQFLFALLNNVSDSTVLPPWTSRTVVVDSLLTVDHVRLMQNTEGVTAASLLWAGCAVQSKAKTFLEVGLPLALPRQATSSTWHPSAAVILIALGLSVVVGGLAGVWCPTPLPWSNVVFSWQRRWRYRPMQNHLQHQEEPVEMSYHASDAGREECVPAPPLRYGGEHSAQLWSAEPPMMNATALSTNHSFFSEAGTGSPTVAQSINGAPVFVTEEFSGNYALRGTTIAKRRQHLVKEE